MAIGDALLTGVQNLKSQWDQWMSDPANRAALLQTGVAMMQPMSVGQNALGQFGQALGQGAEAKNRYETTQRNEEQIQYERNQAASDRTYKQSEADRAYKLEARKVGIQEQNAASLNEYRKQGGRSLSSLFAKDQDQLAQKLWNAATAAANVHNNSLNAFDEGFVPKTPQDFLADPTWVQQNTAILNSMPGMPGTTTYAQPQATGTTAPPQAPQTPPPVSAPTIINPKTGQRMRLENGKWVPM